MAKPSSPPIRVRLLIDREIQGALLCRAGVYAAAGLLYMCCVLYFSQAMSDPSLSWLQHLADFAYDAFHWAPGLLVLLPIVAHDVLRLSNRFAGPIFRLRTEMKLLAAGEEGREIKFRDEDQLTDLAPLYNQIRAELLDLRQQVKQSAKTARSVAAERAERATVSV